jgi:Regulator of Vps4 activity in the MVB pathway
VSSLIYAAARVTDLQELGAIKSLLAAKFGKEYAAEAASDHLCRKWHVNDNLIRRVWCLLNQNSLSKSLRCWRMISSQMHRFGCQHWCAMRCLSSASSCVRSGRA